MGVLEEEREKIIEEENILKRDKRNLERLYWSAKNKSEKTPKPNFQFIALAIFVVFVFVIKTVGEKGDEFGFGLYMFMTIAAIVVFSAIITIKYRDDRNDYNNALDVLKNVDIEMKEVENRETELLLKEEEFIAKYNENPLIEGWQKHSIPNPDEDIYEKRIYKIF